MPDTNPNYLTAIHELLVRYFDQSELKTLCFKLGISYDDLSGENRTEKARELVNFLNRRDQLPALKTVVLKERPQIDWPQPDVGVSLNSHILTPVERWQLSQADFDQLAGLLAGTSEFRTVSGRVDFLDDVFAGSPRKNDVLGLINLDGAPAAWPCASSPA
ncbi:MAG: hypothetical protein M5U34_37340 [Chloroflexi bacterium]|nr:hypothetical protein [Chloroflexota bacterium]